MGVNGEALQLHAVYKKSYFLLLQVTQEFVSGTTNHLHCIWMCNEIEGSYYHSTKLYRKKYHSLPLTCTLWQQQTRDIFRYSIVLWWYLYIIIRLTHANVLVNGEALQLHAVYEKPYFVVQVTQESVSVLQVTWVAAAHYFIRHSLLSLIWRMEVVFYHMISWN